MKMSRYTALFLGVIMLGWLGSAQATTELSVAQSGSLVADCGVSSGCTTFATGRSWTGSFNVFTLFVTTGFSIGTGGAVNMDLGLSATTSGASTAATIVWVDTGFTVTGGTITIGNTVLTGGSASLTLYADTANVVHDATFNFATCGTCTSLGTFNSNGTFSIGTVPSTPYSLAMVLTITPTGVGGFSIDDHVTKIPEPASMLLFGIGLVGVGMWGRKRLSK